MQKFELIVAIINRGFSDLVMDSAREQGATGGTIINARGTVVDEAQTIMGISIQPEKEIVLILAKKEKRNDIMSAICLEAGLNTLGKGIVFSLQVEDVLGITLDIENFHEIINNENATTKTKHISKKNAAKAEASKMAITDENKATQNEMTESVVENTVSENGFTTDENSVSENEMTEAMDENTVSQNEVTEVVNENKKSCGKKHIDD